MNATSAPRIENKRWHAWVISFTRDAIPFGGPQNFVQAYQDLNSNKGRHSFRFGGNYTYIRDRTGAYEEAVESLADNFRTSLENH
jgi:hypothetical protein